jgi:peptidoglycan/xylan/chitin deacetylase (PgdA/CDA1 family)
MYHTITEFGGEKSRYGLPAGELEAHLQFLQKMKMRSVLLADVWKAQRGDTVLPPHCVVITFDDGYANHYSHALPALEKYGFRAVFFVLSGAVGKTGHLTEEQVSDLSHRGMSVQSHAHTHRLLDQLSEDEIEYELLKSREVLAGLTDGEIDFLCVPGGWYDERVVRIARANGFKAICSSNIGMSSSEGVEYVLPRLEVRGDVEVTDFSDIFSTSRIAWERMKRDCKLAVHRILGSSGYVWLGHAISSRMYYFWGGTLLVLVLAVGGILLFRVRRGQKKAPPR